MPNDLAISSLLPYVNSLASNVLGGMGAQGPVGAAGSPGVADDYMRRTRALSQSARPRPTSTNTPFGHHFQQAAAGVAGGANPYLQAQANPYLQGGTAAPGAVAARGTPSGEAYAAQQAAQQNLRHPAEPADVQALHGAQADLDRAKVKQVHTASALDESKTANEYRQNAAGWEDLNSGRAERESEAKIGGNGINKQAEQSFKNADLILQHMNKRYPEGTPPESIPTDDAALMAQAHKDLASNYRGAQGHPAEPVGRQPGGMAAQLTPGTGGVISPELAQKYYQAAGGDPEYAKKMMAAANWK